MTLTDALHRLQAWQDYEKNWHVAIHRDAIEVALLDVDVPALLAEAQKHADNLSDICNVMPSELADLTAAADWLAPREVLADVTRLTKGHIAEVERLTEERDEARTTAGDALEEIRRLVAEVTRLREGTE